MCNLYTLAPWEVRHLIQHYRLIGRDFEEVMRGCNETLDVYPNRRCVVPATALSEPDKNTPKGSVVWRWFERADKQPFFFLPGSGGRGLTIEAPRRCPNIADHALFSIMTTEPNPIVEPIHEKAMPVMLMKPDDVEQWLKGGSVEDALKMQKPAPDDAIVIRPEEKKAA